MNEPYQNQNNKQDKNKNIIILILSCIIGVVVLTTLTVAALFVTGVIDMKNGVQSVMVESNPAATVEPSSVPATTPPTAPPAVTAPPAATAPPTPVDNTIKEYKYVVNVKTSIYLRSSPSETDNVITEIPLGEVVGYIESASSVFAKVDYHGTIGYSKHEYLSANPPVYQKKQSPSAQNITYLQVQNVKTSIYLRSSPSSNGGIIMEIPVGEYVEFLENANGTFYKIRYNGTVGYSKSEYLG